MTSTKQLAHQLGKQLKYVNRDLPKLLQKVGVDEDLIPTYVKDKAMPQDVAESIVQLHDLPTLFRRLRSQGKNPSALTKPPPQESTSPPKPTNKILWSRKFRDKTVALTKYSDIKNYLPYVEALNKYRYVMECCAKDLEFSQMTLSFCHKKADLEPWAESLNKIQALTEKFEQDDTFQDLLGTETLEEDQQKALTDVKFVLATLRKLHKWHQRVKPQAEHLSDNYEQYAKELIDGIDVDAYLRED